MVAFVVYVELLSLGRRLIAEFLFCVAVGLLIDGGWFMTMVF